MAKTRTTKLQKLRDMLADASARLTDLAPLTGRGPNARYEDAHNARGEALRELLKYECGLHVSEWHWDGYEGRWCFAWEFSTRLHKAGAHETEGHFCGMRVPSSLDDSADLDAELDRLQAEAHRLAKLRDGLATASREVRS